MYELQVILHVLLGDTFVCSSGQIGRIGSGKHNVFHPSDGWG